jgi:ABC-type transport system involved in multi-copper enzyme maturation permease subunit
MRLLVLVKRSAVQAKYVLLGAAVVLPLFQFLLIAQAAEIDRSNAFGRMAEFVPVFLQRGIGSQAMLLATFRGTVSFGYFHPVIVCILSLVAMYITTEPAHEIESGLVDLVLARSVPRLRLLTRSLVLGFGSIAAIVVLMMFGTYVGLRWLAPAAAGPSPRLIALLAAHLVGVAWCCGAIGLLFASLGRRWTSVFTCAAIVVVVGYLIDFLALGWPAARTIAWVTPFQYYPALLIIGGTSDPVRDLGVLGVATAAFIALAYWRFNKRDL